MPFFSDKSRRAFFYRLGQMANPRVFHDDYSRFNRQTNKEIIDGIHYRLKEKSLRDFIKETDEEFNSRNNSKFSRLSNLGNCSQTRGCDQFSNRFAAESISIDVDPIKYNTGVLIEEAIRNYDQNRYYFDKYHISKDDLILIELAKNNLLNESGSNVQVGQAT